MEAHHSREECSEDGFSLVVRLVYPVAQGRTEDRPQPVSDSPPCVVGKLRNIAGRGPRCRRLGARRCPSSRRELHGPAGPE